MLWRAIGVLACVIAGLLHEAPVPAIAAGYALGIQTSQRSGKVPFTVTFRFQIFDPSGSVFAGGTMDFGDGSGPVDVFNGGKFLAALSHGYIRPGTFTAVLAMVKADGKRVTQKVRIHVEPSSPPDPGELLKVDPASGEEPFDTSFAIGGASLAFAPTSVTLDFGDGSSGAVKQSTTVRHRYEKAGQYTARLLAQGPDGNLANASATMTVVHRPELTLEVTPRSGVAPLQATIKAEILVGSIRQAEVRVDGKTLTSRPGITTFLFTEPGEHTVTLVADTTTGRHLTKEVKVNLFERSLAGYYRHNGGVVEIVGGPGGFQGIMRAPTLGQAKAGYDIGRMFVRGAYADVAPSKKFPPLGGEVSETNVDFANPNAARLAQGEYLVLKKNCPDQWANYRFRIDFGERSADGSQSRPASINGPVTYRNDMEHYEHAYKRLARPPPRPGIVGKVEWEANLIKAMLAAGEPGKPHECTLDDRPTVTMAAEFERITEAEAAQMAADNIKDVQEFARHAYDGVVPPLNDGTQRDSDPDQGQPDTSKDPVHLHSGELVLTEEDLILAGRGLDWSFIRTYRSQSREMSGVGMGWTFSDEHDLIRDSEGFRLRIAGEAWHRLSPLSPTLFADPAGRRLLGQGDELIARDITGTLLHFRPAAGVPGHYWIMKVEDPSGNRLIYEHDLVGRITRVTDTFGRAIRYDYDGQKGLLSAVTVPDGRRIAFEHDDEGRLLSVRVSVPGAGTPVREQRYSYRGGGKEVDPDLRSNLVAAWSQDNPAGKPLVEVQYGEAPGAADFDRVIWQRSGRSVERFHYARLDTALGQRFQTTVEAEGRATEVHLFRPDGLLESISYQLPDGKVVTSRREYGPDGKFARAVLPLGDAVETIPYGNRATDEELRLVPIPGSQTPPVAYLVEHDPLFGAVRAVYGPFRDHVPADRSEVDTRLLSLTRFDYEEGDRMPEALARFGLERPEAAAAGDLNGDGKTAGAAGLAVAVSVPGEATVNAKGPPLVTTTLRYDVAGLPAEERWPDGRRLLFRYQNGPDGAPAFLSRVVEIGNSGAERLLAGYEWDAEGRLLGLSNADGPIVAAALDGLGRPTTIIPAGKESPRRRLTYDASGRVIEEQVLTAVEEAAGGRGHDFAKYGYDAAGNLISLQLQPAEGATPISRVYGYDDYGRLTSITAGNLVWQREFDQLGRITGEGIKDSDWTAFAYDDDGRVVDEVRSGGSPIHFGYDGLGRLISVDGAEGRIERVLDDRGALIERRLIDPGTRSGTVEGFRRSPYGRLAEAWVGQIVDGMIVGRRVLARIDYDEYGHARTVERDGAAPLDVHLDDFGVPDVLEVKGGAGLVARIGRDRGGRIVSIALAGATEREVAYDAFDRVTALYGPGSERLRVSHGIDGEDIASQLAEDGSERIRTIVARDRIGRPVRIRQEAGSAVIRDWTLGFDDFARLTRVTAGNQPIANVAYDAIGRIAKASFFGLGGISFDRAPAPDADGFAPDMALTDARGARMEFKHDKVGRVTTVMARLADHESETEIIEYDGLGRPRLERLGGWQWDRGEDPSGNTVVERLVGPDGLPRGIVRRLDATGALTGYTLPSGLEVRVVGRSAGALRVNVSGQEIQLTYAEDGSLVGIETGPVTLTRTPLGADSGAEAAQTIRLSVAGETHAAWRWTFAGGRLVREELSPGDVSLRFDRDPDGRLAGGTALVASTDGRPLPMAFSISRDLIGNRIEARFGASAVAYEPRQGFGYARIGQAEAVYDADGRMTKLAGEAFEYDALGNLISYRDGTRGLAITYARDIWGRVVERRSLSSSTVFMHDEAGLVGVYPSSGPPREWLRDEAGRPFALAIGGEVLLAAVGLDGSLLALIDRSGKVRERYDYGPFGEVMGTDGDGHPTAIATDALFQGMLYDPEARLYLPSMRPYRPDIGSFLAPEPGGPLVAYHAYAYGLDDPLSFREVEGGEPGPLGPGGSISETPRKPWDRATGGLGKGVTGKLSGGKEGGGGGPGETPSYRSAPFFGKGADENEKMHRAERDAFKRNVRTAGPFLPAGVRRDWLGIDPGNETGGFITPDPGAVITRNDGPDGPAGIDGGAADPNEIVRDVLRDPWAPHDQSSADRLASVFGGVLANPASGLSKPVPTPGGSTTDATDAVKMPVKQGEPTRSGGSGASSPLGGSLPLGGGLWTDPFHGGGIRTGGGAVGTGAPPSEKKPGGMAGAIF